MLHDAIGGDTEVGVGREHALEQVLARLARAPRRLILAGNDAGEELLQPHQVVCTVVSPLGEWQHSCACTHTF